MMDSENAASKSHSRQDVLIIRRALADVPGTAQLALSNLEEQFWRLEEQLQAAQERPEWVTCDYQPEKREDDPGGRSCTEAINWCATENARLKEQFETLHAAATEMFDFLWHEKETKEPSTADLDLGYVALESSKDYEREEELGEKLGIALGRDVNETSIPAKSPHS